MQHLLLQLKRHIESVYEENRYYKYNICCYSLKDTLNPFMKEINIPNTTFVGYSLKDTLNPFMKEINIPNATFVVKVTVKKTHCIRS